MTKRRDRRLHHRGSYRKMKREFARNVRHLWGGKTIKDHLTKSEPMSTDGSDGGWNSRASNELSTNYVIVFEQSG